MNSDSLISIILPIYNAENYLKKTLESLQAQTHKNIEVLMIDDGSKDSSVDICKLFANNDSRFLYFYQKNTGVSSARNKGLSIAKGKYITFVDSDDYVEADYIEVLNELIVDYDSDISIISFFDRNSQSEQDAVCVLKQEDAIKEIYSGKKFEGFICGKLFKRELFNNIIFPNDIAILEDMIVCANLITKAKHIVFKNTPKYHYVQNPQSATKMKWNPKTWTCLKAADELYDIIAQNYPEEINLGKYRACTTVMVVPQKLSGCGMLTKEKYDLLRVELLRYYSNEVYKIASKKNKLEFCFFLKGRIIYIIYRKIVKNKFARFLREFLTKRGLM